MKNPGRMPSSSLYLEPKNTSPTYTPPPFRPTVPNMSRGAGGADANRECVVLARCTPNSITFERNARRWRRRRGLSRDRPAPSRRISTSTSGAKRPTFYFFCGAKGASRVNGPGASLYRVSPFYACLV